MRALTVSANERPTAASLLLSPWLDGAEAGALAHALAAGTTGAGPTKSGRRSHYSVNATHRVAAWVPPVVAPSPASSALRASASRVLRPSGPAGSALPDPPAAAHQASKLDQPDPAVAPSPMGASATQHLMPPSGWQLPPLKLPPQQPPAAPLLPLLSAPSLSHEAAAKLHPSHGVVGDELPSLSPPSLPGGPPRMLLAALGPHHQSAQHHQPVQPPPRAADDAARPPMRRTASMLQPDSSSSRAATQLTNNSSSTGNLPLLLAPSAGRTSASVRWHPGDMPRVAHELSASGRGTADAAGALADCDDGRRHTADRGGLVVGPQPTPPGGTAARRGRMRHTDSGVIPSPLLVGRQHRGGGGATLGSVSFTTSEGGLIERPPAARRSILRLDGPVKAAAPPPPKPRGRFSRLLAKLVGGSRRDDDGQDAVQ